MVKDFDISSKKIYTNLMYDTMCLCLDMQKEKCLKFLLFALKIIILSVFYEKIASELKGLRPPMEYSICPLFFVMMLKSHLFTNVLIFTHGIFQCKVSP